MKSLDGIMVKPYMILIDRLMINYKPNKSTSNID